MFSVLDLYRSDPAQQLITAGHGLDDLSDLSVRCVMPLLSHSYDPFFVCDVHGRWYSRWDGSSGDAY